MLFRRMTREEAAAASPEVQLQLVLARKDTECGYIADAQAAQNARMGKEVYEMAEAILLHPLQDLRRLVRKCDKGELMDLALCEARDILNAIANAWGKE